MVYTEEIWLGCFSGGWNWDIKSHAESDYKGKAEACDRFIEELVVIKNYYTSLIKEVGNNG